MSPEGGAEWMGELEEEPPGEWRRDQLGPLQKRCSEIAPESRGRRFERSTRKAGRPHGETNRRLVRTVRKRAHAHENRAKKRGPTSRPHGRLRVGEPRRSRR